MASLFGHGNPLATPVGQLIERATDGSQASEDWGLFMEVCDTINEADEGPKDAIKAFKKRLSQNVGKNFTSVMYTLTCLETCVKNCGWRFHVCVATKDFLQELVKVIGPKHDPPQAVQEKVLQLIQTWADAFRGTPQLKEMEKTYQELKSKGIEFPMTDLDNMAPIHTPARTAPHPPPSQPPGGMPAGPMPGSPVMPIIPSEPVILNPEQRSKLSRELEVVSGNVRVMSEMLTEMSPSTVQPADLELMQELNRTCRQMQQRVMQLLGEVANEEVTNELLRVNDDLNNVFLRYDRFERNRTGQGAPEGTEPSTAADQQPPSYDQVCAPKDASSGVPAQGGPNLIDLGESAVTPQMANLNLNSASGSQAPASGAAGDDFDMFAQSRQSFDENKQAQGSAYSNQKEDQMGGGLGQAVSAKSQGDQEVLQLQDKESDYDEMEQWLATHDPNTATDSAGKSEGLTSSEFDRFLTERASAAEGLPTISAQTGQQPGTRNSRQLKKDDEENPLFAL
ncbi:target of Myb1 membrane trafficking protein-like isoform X3 [Babylonia areolata]|uniref:target of Myb1 membrane trafficking protein-like isoform X3 n=1 Tax=Babylonia areolata TaxID=304850 RepID=UPI003FD02239